MSPLALGMLKVCEAQPYPREQVPAAVVDTLLEQGLIEIVQAASPYPTHGGRDIDHILATLAGRERLGQV